jgi:uncharacterized protein
MQKLCATCAAAFECTQAPGCWCAELPHALKVPDPPTDDCLCPACLRARIEQQTALCLISPSGDPAIQR